MKIIKMEIAGKAEQYIFKDVVITGYLFHCCACALIWY